MPTLVRCPFSDTLSIPAHLTGRKLIQASTTLLTAAEGSQNDATARRLVVKGSVCQSWEVYWAPASLQKSSNGGVVSWNNIRETEVTEKLNFSTHGNSRQIENGMHPCKKDWMIKKVTALLVHIIKSGSIRQDKMFQRKPTVRHTCKFTKLRNLLQLTVSARKKCEMK